MKRYSGRGLVLCFDYLGDFCLDLKIEFEGEDSLEELNETIVIFTRHEACNNWNGFMKALQKQTGEKSQTGKANQNKRQGN